MSNSYNPQQVPGQGPAPWPQNPQAGQHGHPQSQPSQGGAGGTKTLPLFLLISIGVLVLLTIGVIVMLFLGGSEGSGTRGVWTFIAFGVFVGFTALDTSRKNMANWYLPAALFVNSYILAMTLIVTWVTKVPEYEFVVVLGFAIFWTLFVTIILMRLLLLACEILQGRHQTRPKLVNISALVSTVLTIIIGFLFTLPLAFSAFEVRLGDLYWKFTISVLVIAALSLSVYVLLVWQFRDEILRSAPGRVGLFLSRKQKTGAPVAHGAHPHTPVNTQGQPYAGQPQGQPLQQPNAAPMNQPYNPQPLPGNAFADPAQQQPFPQQPTGNFVPVDQPNNFDQQARPESTNAPAFETQSNDLGRQDQAPVSDDNEPPFAVRSTGAHSVAPGEAPQDSPAHAEPEREAPLAEPEPVADALTDQEPEVFGTEEPAAQQRVEPAPEPATSIEELLDDANGEANGDDAPTAAHTPTDAPKQTSTPVSPEPAPNEDGLLPWPTFADGTPIPPRPDGQPDFSVPGAPKPPHLQ